MSDLPVAPGNVRAALRGLEQALRSRTCPRCGKMNTMHVGRGRRRCLACLADYDPKPNLIVR